MYTTIEPRLIALLNPDVPSPSYTSPSLDLAPLNDPNIHKASGRPLLLEPDAVKRSAKFGRGAGLDSQVHTLISGVNGEEKNGGSAEHKHGKKSIDRTLGNSSPQSLRKILDDGHDSAPVSSKKRAVPESSKDDFVQLPQPVKKLKTAAKQVVPPIIIGLFEPPPQAALFPPIASSSFHDSHGRNALNTIAPQAVELKEVQTIEHQEEVEVELEEPSKPEVPSQPTPKKKDVRSRKKWTEGETNNLLLGVHKHGIGNWTDILEDPEFTFNSRSGADLKDRFRTCCPAELKGSKSSGLALDKRVKSKSSLMTENILIDDSKENTEGNNDEATGKTRKNKSHRKKLEDLAELGIDSPFRKSLRRERRPFTEQEDKWILEGYELHGASWTRIQRDPKFQLQSRQPTDLRDRFRNKYSEKFRAEKEKEKIKGSEKESRPLISPHSSFDSTSGLNENESMKQAMPSSRPTTSSDHGLNGTVEKRTTSSYIVTNSQITPTRDGLRIEEILSTVQTPSKTSQPILHFSDSNTIDADTLPFTQPFDWSNPIAAPFSTTMGEMDISRLLLDESWPEINGTGNKDKHMLSSILSGDVHGGGGESSFYGMLEDGEKEVWGGV